MPEEQISQIFKDPHTVKKIISELQLTLNSSEF